ncbi:hypothetical protein ACOSP7_016805 [Xanthoceras sorbifolium]
MTCLGRSPPWHSRTMTSNPYIGGTPFFIPKLGWLDHREKKAAGSAGAYSLESPNRSGFRKGIESRPAEAYHSCHVYLFLSKKEGHLFIRDKPLPLSSFAKRLSYFSLSKESGFIQTRGVTSAGICGASYELSCHYAHLHCSSLSFRGPGIGIRPVFAVLESVALIAHVESAGSNSDLDERFSQWKLYTTGRGEGSFRLSVFYSERTLGKFNCFSSSEGHLFSLSPDQSRKTGTALSRSSPWTLRISCFSMED